MNADVLRKRAQHLQELAKLVADERARQAALFLAADYDHQADALERGGPDNDRNDSSMLNNSPV